MILSRNFADYSKGYWEILKNLNQNFWMNLKTFLNSGRILKTEFGAAKIRMIRSLGNRIFQPWFCASCIWSARTSTPGRPTARCRVERFGCRAIESLHIRIQSNFCQNSGKFSQFFRNSANFKTSQHFLEYSVKFRGNFIKIGANFVENYRKKFKN